MSETGSPPDRHEPTPENRAAEFAKALETANNRATLAEADAADLRTTMNRRDFIDFMVGATGGVVFGGLTGWGIAHWNKSTESAVVVSAPAAGVAGADVIVLYPRTRIAALSGLETGVPVPFDYPLVGQTAALVKLGKPAQYGLGPDADIVAFSTKCTHMGWPLDGTFNPDECVFGPCPGHFSTFDASVSGQVVLGQASVRLPQIVLAIEDDAIYAEGTLGLIYGYRMNLLDGEPVEVTA